jgi:hypothetical protein
MLQTLVLIAAAGLLACSGLIHEEPCGRQRSLSVQDTTESLTVDLSLVDEESRPDGLSWEITVTETSSVTAVHLHDATPGNGDRMLYDLTTADLNPAAGFTVAGGGTYSFTTSIESLFGLVRNGNTYIDVHSTVNPGGEIRYDITAVQFEDWSDYFCS